MKHQAAFSLLLLAAAGFLTTSCVCLSQSGCAMNSRTGPTEEFVGQVIQVQPKEHPDHTTDGRIASTVVRFKLATSQTRLAAEIWDCPDLMGPAIVEGDWAIIKAQRSSRGTWIVNEYILVVYEPESNSYKPTGAFIKAFSNPTLPFCG